MASKEIMEVISLVNEIKSLSIEEVSSRLDEVAHNDNEDDEKKAIILTVALIIKALQS